MHHVFVLSDSTGRTAQQLLQAALTQFSETRVRVHLHREVRTEKQVVHVIEQAASVHGFVVHTLVSKKLREVLQQTGRLHNIETIDLLGPVLAQLSQLLSDAPTESPGKFYELNKDYFRRIEAIHFALRHDDGKRIEQVSKAEIVLLGVSRTFKTPLSMYLAYKGWFVANVPIVLDIELPSTVFRLPAGRVFGLFTESKALSRLRQFRFENWKGAANDYADPDFVSLELGYAKKVFDSRPDWPIINVTNKPIEEIGSEILSIIRNRTPLKNGDKGNVLPADLNA